MKVKVNVKEITAAVQAGKGASYLENTFGSDTAQKYVEIRDNKLKPALAKAIETANKGYMADKAGAAIKVAKASK